MKRLLLVLSLAGVSAALAQGPAQIIPHERIQSLQGQIAKLGSS